MSDKIALRPVALTDNTLISAMITQAFVAGEEAVPHSPAWTPKSVAEIISMPGFKGILASSEGEPLGFLLCRTAADEAEILNLGVLASARRCGLARAMLEEFIIQAQALGAARIFLEVASRNKGAQAFYSAFGFKGVGRRREYYSIGEEGFDDALVLVRQLSRQ